MTEPLAPTAADPLDDKELKKAWLKRLFVSYEYRLHLLRIHDEWLGIIKKALARACAEEDARHGEPHPTDLMVPTHFQGPKVRTGAAHFFRTKYLPLIEEVSTPDNYTREFWMKHAGSSGGFRAVGDYGRYIGTPNFWEWMTPDEKSNLDQVWMSMNQVATNIRRTIDKSWERTDPYVILNPRYTGPIDWPKNWKADLVGSDGLQLLEHETLRAKSGDPAPKAGTWQAIDPGNRRVTLNAGDPLPESTSAYGITVWQHIGDSDQD